jgi:hypothetical protein
MVMTKREPERRWEAGAALVGEVEEADAAEEEADPVLLTLPPEEDDVADDEGDLVAVTAIPPEFVV